MDYRYTNPDQNAYQNYENAQYQQPATQAAYQQDQNYATTPFGNTGVDQQYDYNQQYQDPGAQYQDPGAQENYQYQDYGKYSRDKHQIWVYKKSRSWLFS